MFMALEYMHDDLLNQLKSYGATNAQQDAWEVLWQTAVASAGDPLPCPKCFYDGSAIGRLKSLPAEPKQARCKCTSCKTHFECPDDD